MRISSKGQITIPQSIRQRFGLLPNTDVIFDINEREEIILHKNMKDTKRGQFIVQCLTGKSSIPMTTDEIMKLTRS